MLLLGQIIMNKIKTYKELFETDSFSGGGAYPGPSVVGPDNAWAGGTIGGGPGNGQSGAFGSGYPKKYAPAKPEKRPFNQTIKQVQSKESKARKKALKKLDKLDRVKMKSFADFNDEKETN